jgi:hypothetical protein
MWLVTLALVTRFALEPPVAPAPEPEPARVSSEQAARLIVDCWGAADGKACVEQARREQI